MAIEMSKIFIFSTLALSAGGITAGTLLFPNTREEKSESPKTKSSSNPIKENELNTVSSTEGIHVPEENKKKCTIYVTDEATGQTSSPKITEILSKHEDIQKFLEDKRKANSQFAGQVERACTGNSKEKFVDTTEGISVYVYEKKITHKWIYSQYMQKDWMKENSVNKDKLNSASS